MKRFRVTEIDTRAYIYEVDAEDESEAEDKVRMGEAEHLHEYDRNTHRQYDIEEVESRGK